MYRYCGRLTFGKLAAAKRSLTNSAVEQPPFCATVFAATVSRKTYVSTPTPSSNDYDQQSGPQNRLRSMSETGTMSKMIMPSDEELFNFTRGRFVANERHELSQRHRTFNVTELARYAARAVQADHCLSVKKYPDGMYNRVLLLSMDNGREVIAKIPNPNAGQPHFTTASEVATMRFAREVLHTPLPEVYAWSSRAQETPVGAEFVLMERLNGVELEHFLPRMNIQDRLEIVKGIASHQKSWASVSFEQFGSLYFPEDISASESLPLSYIDDEGRRVQEPRFVVGPSTGREMFDDGRANIEFNRGPWESLEDYHVAIGEREIASVRTIPQLPSSPVTLHGPDLYEPTRENKTKALQTYLKVFKYLLPADRHLGSAHIWHGDLHAGNIFVDSANPTQIVGLIDWQSTEIAPLYFQARQPHFIDHEGPTMHGLERPVLPPNLAQLDDNGKKKAHTLFLHQSLCALYRKIVYQECPKIFDCLEFQESTAFTLLLLARNILVDGEASYMAQVYELDDIWETLPGTQGIDFPIIFSEAEIQVIQADMENAALGMDAMRKLREVLGDLYPEQGYVSPDKHMEAVGVLSQARNQVLSELLGKTHEPEE